MNQTKKHTTGKKLLALLLALIMSVSLLPMSVFAAAVDVPETELQVTEPVEEDMQEPEVTDVEGEGDADVQNMEGGAAVYADAAQINYVEKTKSVPLKDGTFYRIVHIDCGRKYFSVTDLKKIIDYAAASNYTHVELAFGNDGLRFLLDDMEVTASGVTYASEAVKSAIQAGNKAFYDAGTNELTQTQMNDIISYANGKGIGIIPMFDAPGHLQAVIRAMQTLNISMVEKTDYCLATKSGTSYNWALIPTNVEGNNFVQELVQKYINYFKTQGCTMFNIAADECGFSYNSDTGWNGMSNEQYTAYARLVNSMAARVQNAGMTALAFNDGIYHKNLTTSVEFDTNIAVCYWDASSDKYAPAATLAGKGFKIINTNNKWYYVLGSEGTGWFGYEWAQGYMNGSNKDCRLVDGGYYTDAGCMLALWCDNPSANVNWTNVENHIKTLSKNNSTYFTKVEVPEEVELPASDTETKVSVVVKGQEGQSAAVKVEAKAPRTEGLPASAEKVVSYEITPSVDNADYTGAGKVTLPVPAEWKDNADRVRGYIVTDGNVKTIQGSYNAATGKYTFDVPHFSEMGLILLAADSTEVTENRTITVTVGGTATDVIDGDYNGNYPTDRTDIAIVEKTEVKNIPASTGDPTKVTTLEDGGKYIIGGGNGNYLMRSGSSLTNTKSADKATEWTITKNTSNNSWIISDSGYYLSYYSSGWTLNLRRDTNQYVSWGYDGTGFRYYDNSNYRLKYWNSNWQITTNPGANGTAYEKGTPAPGGNQTTITFKGVAVGTTHVTIGNVKYTINVIAEDLTSVSPLPIQLWITNNTIQVDTTDATKTGLGWGGDASLGTANYVSVSAGKAYGEQGITVVEALGLTEPLVRHEWGGTRFITARDSKPAQNLVFWTGRIHNSSASNIQTVWGTDYSNAGDAFNYVRYYGGKWQVSADRVNWTTVTGAGSTGSMSGCTQQLAAYYMTRTEITKEVTTDVADWGKPKDGTEYDSQVASDFVLLDYAVKYADGNRVPNTFPVSNKTLAYHCDSGPVGTNNGTKYRMLNNFRGIETENFEVYMITVTMTSDSLTATEAKNGYTYDDTTEQIVWAIDEDARAQSGLADYTSISGSSTYSGCKIGGAMDIRGVEIYNKHGALITYYVRAKAEVEDKLIVNYYVQGETTPFYSYEIAVKADTTFDHGFARTTDPLGLTKNSVENIIGQQETVNWQLEKMPQIKAQYRYSEYDFVDANIDTNDYKTVNLYYTFKAEKTFVVDFGLPLKITPGKINENLVNANVTLEGVNIGKKSNYADIKADEKYNIIYTLTKTIDGNDTFSLQYTGKLMVDGTAQEGKSAEYTITVIPASTVYYEDSFAKFYGSDGAEQKSFEQTGTGVTETPGTWYVDGAKENSTPDQALEELGNKNNVYGYDPAYNTNSTTFSMGSAKKVTVDATKLVYDPTVKFTFKGTGFDVISLTDNNSGAIVVNVERKDTNTTGYEAYNKNFLVNNYYGYSYDKTTHEWTVDNSAENNALYQIPVMKVTGLPYGEYAVTITVGYGAFFDKTNDGKYSFWMDAIRVYDPMGKDYADYTQDQEGYPQYIKLRDALASGEATPNENLLFIDGADKAEVTLYKNYGPNNEVYLAGGQAISFKLTGDLDKIATIQVGAKKPDGSDAVMIVNNKNVSIANSATEMYYTITRDNNNCVTITNTGTDILSLTNLKVTFTSAGTVSLTKTSTQEQANAVAAVRALFTAPEPDPEPVVFAPEYFQATWNRGTVKVGQKATLTVKTSTDVETVTVNGQDIGNYRVRTERTGWGWNAKKVTYHVFTYTVTAAEAGALDVSVAAVNAEGVSSAAVTATLTVQAASQRPGIGGWLDNIFGRWF